VTIVLSVSLTVLTVLISIIGLLLFRRMFLKLSLKDHHDVADPYSQFVGMLFAVLLGFMVADAMQRFGNARSVVEQEASAIGNIYRLSDGLKSPKREEIQNTCQTYLETVVQKEWAMMAKKETCRESWAAYKKLWDVCINFDPVTTREANIHQCLLPTMESVGENRRLRVDALHNGLPPVLWAVLIVGGIATIIFTYFFNIDNVKLQIVMVGMVSLVICLNIFLLATYDDPFSGDVKITADPFETQLYLFKMSKQNFSNAP